MGLRHRVGVGVPSGTASAREADPIELRLENVERAFVPDDVIRREHFLFDRPLRGEALFEALGCY